MYLKRTAQLTALWQLEQASIVEVSTAYSSKAGGTAVVGDNHLRLDNHSGRPPLPLFPQVI
eukprot:scaffold5490_cov125-Cylindrotheca_fusiformis.AAC.4